MFSKTDKVKALRRIRSIRDGKGGRNALAQLSACKLILEDGAPSLETATDAELLAQVAKRGLQVPVVDLDAAEKAMEARDGQT